MNTQWRLSCTLLLSLGLSAQTYAATTPQTDVDTHPPTMPAAGKPSEALPVSAATSASSTTPDTAVKPSQPNTAASSTVTVRRSTVSEDGQITTTTATEQAEPEKPAAPQCAQMDGDREEFADPFEEVNRLSFEGSDTLDKAIIAPVARAYDDYTPSGLRTCASNFFDNMNVPYTMVNNLLQGKVLAAGEDVLRFTLNSTLGIGGCIDVATAWGVPHHKEDFGQTLGAWGVPTGSFVMLPLLGPSNIRDAIARPIDFLANPLSYLTNTPTSTTLTVHRLIDTRANLLEMTDELDAVAIDKYAMVRDIWMQTRQAQVDDLDGSYADKPAKRPSACAPAK